MGRALVNKLKENKTYYPIMDISYTPGSYKDNNLKIVDGFEVTMATLVRLQNTDDEWYICPVIKHWVTDSKNYEKNSNFFINSFLNDAYKASLFGVVDKTIRTIEGHYLFERDRCQINEKERIKELSI